jgi:hypothetical protein
MHFWSPGHADHPPVLVLDGHEGLPGSVFKRLDGAPLLGLEQEGALVIFNG